MKVPKVVVPMNKKKNVPSMEIPLHRAIILLMSILKGCIKYLLQLINTNRKAFYSAYKNDVILAYH